MIASWKARARQLKRDVFALMLAYKDPRVPWYARLFVVCLLGYAFSPIDLIPDFIPILGLLDDFILLPMGIFLAIKLIPPSVLAEYREQAQKRVEQGKPKNWIGAVAIVLVWLLCAGLVGLFVVRRFF